MLLEGKRAIVTGAGSGIGKASAQLFAQEGAKVLAVDLPGSEVATAHADIAAIEFLEQDVTEEGAPGRIVQAAVDAFGGLDILFNNAGVSGRFNAVEMPVEHWDHVHNVNVRHSFYWRRRLFPICASRAPDALSTQLR